MPRSNLRKQPKFGENEGVSCHSNVDCKLNPDMAASPTHEASSTGMADPDDAVAERAALGELGPAPSTAALAKYLKEAMHTFQSMLDKAVKSVIESVKKVERALEFEGLRIDDLEKKNKELEGRLDRMEKTCLQLQQKVVHQEAEMNKAERFSRRNNCRLVGIPEPPSEREEDCIQVVENILKDKFKSNIKVERAHRDGKRGDRPCHIIFKTLSYREKVDIMKSARHSLQGEKFYLTDDMTKSDLEGKKKHAKEVQELYKKGTKLRFYAGHWRGNGGVPYFSA